MVWPLCWNKFETAKYFTLSSQITFVAAGRTRDAVQWMIKKELFCCEHGTNFLLHNNQKLTTTADRAVWKSSTNKNTRQHITISWTTYAEWSHNSFPHRYRAGLNAWQRWNAHLRGARANQTRGHQLDYSGWMNANSLFSSSKIVLGGCQKIWPRINLLGP